MYLYKFSSFFVLYVIKIVISESLSLKHTNISPFENDSILKSKTNESNGVDSTTNDPTTLKEEFGEGLFPVRIIVTMKKTGVSFLEMESTLKETVEMGPVSKFEHLFRVGCYMIEMSEDCTKAELNLLIDEINNLGGLVEFDALASPQTIDNNTITRQESSGSEGESDKGDSKFSIGYDPKQWHIQEMNVDKAWSKIKTMRTREVRVCVIDSGIDYEHPGFSGRLAVENLTKRNSKRSRRTPFGSSDDLIDGVGSQQTEELFGEKDYLLSANFVDDNFNPTDNYGHGTHISGIIASNSGTSRVAGINPFARIVSCKAFENGVELRVSNIVRCIDFCIYSKAEIQNHSWIVTKDLKFLKKAFIAAFKKDIIMVVAAGNINTLKKIIPKNSNLSPNSDINLNIDETKQFPAVYSRIFPNVVTTANLMILDKIKSKHMLINCLLKSKGPCREFRHLGLNGNSMFGTGSVQIAAPGTNIYSLYPGDRYSITTGTSTSTAMVTGVISMIRSIFPKKSYKRLTSYHTIQILRESVKIVPNLEDKVGWRGFPDCLSALDLATIFLKSMERRPKRFKTSNSKVEI